MSKFIVVVESVVVVVKVVGVLSVVLALTLCELVVLPHVPQNLGHKSRATVKLLQSFGTANTQILSSIHCCFVVGCTDPGTHCPHNTGQVTLAGVCSQLMSGTNGHISSSLQIVVAVVVVVALLVTVVVV